MGLDSNNQWLLTPLGEGIMAKFIKGCLSQIIPKHVQPSSDDKKENNPDCVLPYIMQVSTQHHLRSLFAKELNLIKPLNPMILEMQRTKGTHWKAAQVCHQPKTDGEKFYRANAYILQQGNLGSRGQGTGIDLQKLPTKCNVDL